MIKSANKSHLWPGVPLALVSAILFGVSAPFSKMLLASIDPLMLASLLYLGAGMGLAAYHVFSKARGTAEREAPLLKADLPWLAAAVAAGGIIAPVLLMFGLSLTDAASGSLLLNLESLATMGIAWLVFRENVDRRLLIGAFAILAGAILLTWNGQGLTLNTGALLIAGACLAWGIDNNLTRKISAADPVVIAMIKGLVAGLVNLVLALSLGAAFPPLSFAAMAGLLGLLSIGVSLVLFIYALRHLGTARTGAYFSLAPFIGALAAILVLGEPLTLKLLGAAVLMGIGLWIHLAERHAHDHEHEMLEHDHVHSHDDHHQHEHDGINPPEPHSHRHKHKPMRHSHVHYPDLHHRHGHGN